jgi:hypothetical protein
MVEFGYKGFGFRHQIWWIDLRQGETNLKDDDASLRVPPRPLTLNHKPEIPNLTPSTLNPGPFPL